MTTSNTYCVSCGSRFAILKNGVPVTFVDQYTDQVVSLYSGDIAVCLCDRQIITGLAMKPLWHVSEGTELEVKDYFPNPDRVYKLYI